MKVLTPGRLPIFSWADSYDDKAFKQLVNLSNHPKVFHHVAAMADCHGGYGMPIGGVVAMDGAIMPNGVGMDIGCGMVARRFSMNVADLSTAQLQAINDRIRDLVPVGLGIVNDEPVDLGSAFIEKFKDQLMHYRVLQEDQLEYIGRSLGSLGAGNHFIEIQYDQDGSVWLMIHTGSRKLGNLVNDRFHKQGAMRLCDMWESKIADPEIAFLPIGTPEASMYIDSMTIALTFAKFNRDIILQKCIQAITDTIGYIPEQEESETQIEVNAHHNYACTEYHYGKTVWVHRKGAIKVAAGEVGIIPGDQASNSFIVSGKGNAKAFNSCSHGAGRKMSRTAANDMISIEDAEASMEGIIHGDFKGKDRQGRVVKDTSEAKGAYKDIAVVMDQQTDLVDIMFTLKQVVNIKG